MEMSERTAAQIRAYLAEDMKLHNFLALVEVDMPRLLEAAVKLREARLSDRRCIIGTAFYSPLSEEKIERLAQQDTLLIETAWLAEGDTDGGT